MPRLPWRGDIAWPQAVLGKRAWVGGVVLASILAGASVSWGKSPALTDHFNGKRFFNPEGGRGKSRTLAVLRWGFTRKPPKWVDVPVTRTVPPKAVDGNEIRATWVGHSTFLIQWQGINILTDPIWSERASPVKWTGPKRHAEPGIRFEDLPRIHAVVISHNHYDHMDAATIKRLSIEHHPQFFVPLRVGAWFQKKHIAPVTELDWWQSRSLGPLSIFSVPVKHFSGRSPTDLDRTLWSGWILKGPDGSVFVAGDTGYTKFFSEIGRRFTPVRLAALPIGAYEPRWFMSPVHIDPAEAVQACVDLGAAHCMGMHFNTFRLTDEPQDEPPIKAKAALAEKGLPDNLFWLPYHGESRSF
ncbi:MAG: MBL fold metallo-hydrolase [Nitrospirae bacterium]|nr:MBL fold metallo-hydrolase [Nitrospirota bacterium]